MKKISVKKEIFIVLLIVIAIITLSSKVFATGTTTSPVQIPGIGTDANPTTEKKPETPSTTTPAPTTQNTDQNTSTYQNTSLPQTGDASDYAIFAVIAVATVVAIFAYRKARNYNV